MQPQACRASPSTLAVEQNIACPLRVYTQWYENALTRDALLKLIEFVLAEYQAGIVCIRSNSFRIDKLNIRCHSPLPLELFGHIGPRPKDGLFNAHTVSVV